MRPILPSFLLVLSAVSAPLAAQNVVAPMALTDTAAREAIDHDAVITGPVVQVKAHGHQGMAYLNFGGRFPDHTFSVMIPDSVAARFGDLTRFEGHRARATGHVWLQDGKWPAMTLTDPARLELLP